MGKYEAAVKKAKYELNRKNPAEYELRILNYSFLSYLDQIEEEINTYKHNSREKELIYTLNKRYDALELYNECREFFFESNYIKLDNFIHKIDQSEKTLFKYYLNIADKYRLRFEESFNKKDAQYSYEQYRKAKDLNYEYPFPEKNMQNMLDNAMERIFVSIDPFETDVKWEFQRSMSKRKGYSIYSMNQSEETDCHVHINCEFFNFSDRVNEISEFHEKEIQDGYTFSCDTAGNRIKTPKYKIIQATTFKTKVTRRAEWSIEFNVNNISGACTKSIRNFRACRDYEITTNSFSGNKKALPACFIVDVFPDELPDEDEIQSDMAYDILMFFERNY